MGAHCAARRGASPATLRRKNQSRPRKKEPWIVGKWILMTKGRWGRRGPIGPHSDPPPMIDTSNAKRKIEAHSSSIRRRNSRQFDFVSFVFAVELPIQFQQIWFENSCPRLKTFYEYSNASRACNCYDNSIKLNLSIRKLWNWSLNKLQKIITYIWLLIYIYVWDWWSICHDSLIKMWNCVVIEKFHEIITSSLHAEHCWPIINL